MSNKKMNTNKIILFEISLPITQHDWINAEAGIWGMTLKPANYTVTDDYGVSGYYSNTNTEEYPDIASVTIDDIIYLKTYSMNDLREQEESFYYDYSLQRLFLHFNDYEYFFDKTITIGSNIGFCNRVDSINGCFYNNQYYEPRIKSIPAITKSKDPLFNGLLRFDGCSVSLINNDRYFRDFLNYNIFKQKSVIKLGDEGDSYSDFVEMFTGYVESMSGASVFKIKIQDIRKGLSRKIPTSFFTQDEYSDLADGDVDKPKPIIYGSVRNAPLVCVNGESEVADPYLFYVGDITSVDAVYIDGDAYIDYSVNGDYIEIDSVDVVDATDTVTADLTGINISNSVSIILDILNDYAGTRYNSTNFNTTEIEAAILQARDSGLFIDEPKEISEIIEMLCVDSDIAFLVQDDGKYTARIFYSGRSVAHTIGYDEWFGEPDISYDPSEFLSALTILYNKDYDSGDFLTLRNNDYEADAVARYKAYQEDEIETNLISSSDARDKSDAIMYFSSEPQRIVKRKTTLDYIDLEVGDFIVGDPEWEYGTFENLGTWEVLGIQKDLENDNILLTLRFLSDYADSYESFYRTTGSASSGITLDVLNSGGGLHLASWAKYDTATVYTPAAYYESSFYESTVERVALELTVSGGDGYCTYQTRTDFNDSWSSEVMASASQTINEGTSLLQVRIIFYAESWSDGLTVTLSEV